jgi:hypothetical protein
MGLLDKIPYRGGIWGVGGGAIAARDLDTHINQILTNEQGVSYELDTALVGITFSGWIPLTTLRAALQQIAFGVGAYITCSRSGAVQMRVSPIVSEYNAPINQSFTDADKGIDQTLSLLSLVTGVEIITHDFHLVTESEILFSATLPVGSHVITFPHPVQGYTKTGTATSSVTLDSANYLIVNVTVEGTVIITQSTWWKDAQALASIYTSGLDSDVKSNIVYIENATLVNTANSEEIVQRTYDYFQQRYLQKMKLFASLVEPGEVVLIDTQSNKKFLGVMERMNSDLAMGFVSRTEVVCIVLPMLLDVGKYDDRDVTALWDNGYSSLTTYPVGYLNTQTATKDDPQSYLKMVISKSAFDIGYIGWNDVNTLHIVIDGGTQIDVDTNTGSGTKTAEIWSSGFLGTGPHVIRLWGGGGGGEYVLLDYVEVFYYTADRKARTGIAGCGSGLTRNNGFR